MEIQELIADGLLPILPVMCSRSGNIGMWYVPFQQFPVQLLINTIKEVTRSAIDYQCQCIGGKPVQ